MRADNLGKETQLSSSMVSKIFYREFVKRTQGLTVRLLRPIDIFYNLSSDYYDQSSDYHDHSNYSHNHKKIRIKRA